MTMTTREQQLKSMAESITHVMDSLETGIAVEVFSECCVFKIEGIDKGFVVGRCAADIATAIESLEFLAPLREGD